MSVTLLEKEKDVYRLRTEEGMSFQAIGEKVGLKTSSARVYYTRARRKLGINEAMKPSVEQAIVSEYTKLPTSPEEMAGACENKAALILASIGDTSIKGATLSQKSRAFSDLIQNSRLLKGEATQIISHEDRRKLKELIPAILLEAKGAACWII